MKKVQTEKAGAFGQEKRTLNLFTKSMSHKKYRGGGIRTPGPMVPNHVLYQTEPHPAILLSSATKTILADSTAFGKSFFHIL